MRICQMHFLHSLEERQDEMAELLTQWVNLESQTSDRGLVNKLAVAVRGEAERFGAEAETSPQREYGEHILLRWGARSLDGPKPVLVLAHIDTVWAVGKWNDGRCGSRATFCTGREPAI